MPTSSWLLRVCAVGVCAAVAVGGCDARQGVKANPQPPAAPKWEIAYSSRSADSSIGLVAVTSTAVWALGDERQTGSKTRRQVLLRSSGDSWQSVALPPEYAGARKLDDVQLAGSASSPDVWLFATLGTLPKAWRRHEDRWIAVPIDFGSRVIQVLTPDDIWSVDAELSLVRHWDGRRWTVLDLPFGIVALSATAADDVWAANAARGPNDELQPALMHFDGHNWQRTPAPEYHFELPHPAAQSASLQSVIGVARGQAWAFGVHDAFSSSSNFWRSEKVVLHWDGTRWEKMPESLHSWAPGADGQGGVILPEAGVQRTAQGQTRSIEPPSLLAGATGKLTEADKAQKLTVRAMTLDTRTKNVWAVGFVGLDTKTGAFARAVILRFVPGGS